MPILYVHGVNVRSRDGFHIFERFARRYLAQEISDDPDGVEIRDVFWGKLAFTPAYGGISRPRSRLFGMGVEETPDRDAAIAALGPGSDGFAKALAAHGPGAGASPDDAGNLGGGGLASGGLGASGDGAPVEGGQDWKAIRELLLTLDADDLSDVLTAIVQGPDLASQEDHSEADIARATSLAISADALATSGKANEVLARPVPDEEAVAALIAAVKDGAASPDGLAGMGLSDWFERTRDLVGEASTRANNLKGYLASVILAEARGPVNDVVSRFLGDVFVYLNGRGTAGAPGPIQDLLLTALKELHAVKADRGGEPLVVVSHSMGGQLMYDAVSHYLPQTPELSAIKVDFWCASASQVGFFEEAKLFHVSDPQYKAGNPAPYPGSNLGAWWNVWDHNDVLSFTAHDIIRGVDDESYSSGSTLISAHGAYLQTPSFYRKMARKIAAAVAPGD